MALLLCLPVPSIALIHFVLFDVIFELRRARRYQLYIDGIEHRRRVERIERDSARDAGSSSGSESGSYTSEGDESSATGSRRK